jgi:hypothetical protein
VAFREHSRFIVSNGLHTSQSAILVLEVLRAGITSRGTPEEVLTDNGTQYVTWRGKSAFARALGEIDAAGDDALDGAAQYFHVLAEPPPTLCALFHV